MRIGFLAGTKVLLAAALSLTSIAAPFSVVQTSASQGSLNASRTQLTNNDILDMTKAGLSPEIIFAKIQASACSFDTSPAALRELKSAGVADSVILAMVKSPSQTPPKEGSTRLAPSSGTESSSKETGATNPRTETSQTPEPGKQSRGAKAGSAGGAQKSVLVVQTFVTVPGLTWPYDMKQLQSQTAADLKLKNKQHLDVTTEAAASQTQIYTLDGEIMAWHPGNRAKRLLVGMGSGREMAQIHYWLTDQDGKRVFDHTDTIRQALVGSAYANSVGELAQPLADKITKRLAEAKLF